MLSEVGALQNLITEILQFPLDFHNQKIKWKGNYQIMNYHVLAEW